MLPEVFLTVASSPKAGPKKKSTNAATPFIVTAIAPTVTPLFAAAVQTPAEAAFERGNANVSAFLTPYMAKTVPKSLASSLRVGDLGSFLWIADPKVSIRRE